MKLFLIWENLRKERYSRKANHKHSDATIAGLAVSLILLALAGAIPFKAYSSTRVVRITVVDTLAAINKMKGSIDRANKPVNDSIAWLYQSIKGLEVKRTLIADSLQKVDYLYSVFLPKIKDKELVGEFLSYFTDVFEKSPDAGVLALAKEKDFTKACKSKDFEEATAKLLAKTKEKALKDISKGKMEAPFVYDTICVRRQRYNDALSNIAQSVSYQKDAIALLEAKLKPVPPFGRKQFIETTGSEDFPLKELILSADAFGPEYRTYRELAEQYPKMAAESITGKFDGIIEDRLAIFPYGIKCNVGSYEIDAFFTMILKSEKGTVPDLILDAQKLHLNDGDNDSEEVYGRPLFGIYDEMHNLKLIPLFAEWDRKEKSSIGVVVKYYPMEPLTDALQESRVSTFVVNDGQWVNKPPFDSKYLTYSQCRDLWADLYEERKIDATPFSFNWKAEDGGYNGKSSDLISFPGGSPEDYAHGVPANCEMVFKSPDLPDLVVPGHGIAGWNVEKNFFGTGKDALILKYGLSQDEGGSYIDVYGIEWDGPFWAYINGNDEHSDLAWTKWYTIIKDIKTHELCPVKTEYDWSKDEQTDERFFAQGSPYKVYIEPSEFYGTEVRRGESPRFIESLKSADRAGGRAFSADSPAAKLLKGVLLEHKLKSVEVLSTTRYNQNWLVELCINGCKLYDALYTPEGSLLDAVYLGRKFIAEDLLLARERTRIDRIGPYRINVSAFKAITDDSGENAYNHDFEYVVTDKSFILQNYKWSFPIHSNPYYWAHIEPEEFLFRFPVSCTPWDLWYKLSRHADGENGESLHFDALPLLYRRNPEAFLLQAYSDLIGIHKDESITLDFLSMNYNYGESLEQGEVAADLEKLSNSNIRTELQRYLQSNSH